MTINLKTPFDLITCRFFLDLILQPPMLVLMIIISILLHIKLVFDNCLHVAMVLPTHPIQTLLFQHLNIIIA
jgi:hypothetical protein